MRSAKGAGKFRKHLQDLEEGCYNALVCAIETKTIKVRI